MVDFLPLNNKPLLPALIGDQKVKNPLLKPAEIGFDVKSVLSSVKKSDKNHDGAFTQEELNTYKTGIDARIKQLNQLEPIRLRLVG